MKHRIKLAVLTVVISVVGLVLTVIQGWRNAPRPIVFNIPAGAITPAPQAIAGMTASPLGMAVAPLQSETISPSPVAAPSTQPAILALPAVVATTETPVVVEDATTMHTAMRGETLDGLAAALRNKETRAYRDAILKANPSLKADPDKLVAGQTYVIPAAADVAANAVPTLVAVEPASPILASATVEPSAPTSSVVEPVAAPAVAPAAPTTELKYTAKSGDTVTNMASAFLGSPDQAHQDAITNANASLKADPDHVVAGKAYKIPVTEGLNAAAEVRPAVQPDADQLVATAAPKTLRYVAKSGDTVTSMAANLLGSDTPDTRNAIINANPTLKLDPDRVVAGATYIIPAPIAAIDPR